MNKETPTPDPALTPEQEEKVALLSQSDLEKIDNVLLKNSNQLWRKVARVIGTTMNELPNRIDGIPDVFYASRIRILVEVGKLESQGDLRCMRFSEIRIPE